MAEVRLTIDGMEVEAREGTTVLEVARDAGIYIPNLCADPDLEPYGACRLCLVEIENVEGLPASCTTPVTEGMVVHTDTGRVNEVRRRIVELLLSDHPDNCLVCPKNQRCELQKIAAYLGIEGQRYKKLTNDGIVEGSLYYHYARMIEALYAAEEIKSLLQDDLICSTEIQATSSKLNEEAVGVVEAPRGTLFHHYWIDPSGVIRKVNLIVATGHNNAAMNRAVEEVAKRYVRRGNLTEGVLNRIEAAIRCYDPCLSCATHALGQMPLVTQLVSPTGEVVQRVHRG